MKHSPEVTIKRTRSINGNARPYQSRGRWYAPGSVTLPDGTVKAIRGTGKTKSKAQANLRKNMKAICTVAKNREMNSDRSKYLVPACIQWLELNWIETRANRGLAFKTLEGCQHAFDKWIEPTFKETRINEVTFKELEELRQSIFITHSHSAWNQVKAVLNHIFHEAARNQIIVANPIQLMRKVKKVKKQANYLSMAEAQLVIAQAAESNQLIRWLLALSVGVRQGEALGLNWKNVHLDGPNPHVYIVEQIQRQKGRGLVIKPPKHNSIRTIPLDDNMVNAFRTHKRLQAERRILAGPLWNEQGFVFTGDLGNPIDSKKDRSAWSQLLVAAGVKRVKLHEARHTAATLMLYLKSTMHTVSKVLGHSSIAITDEIYAHVITESIGEAVSGLSTHLLYGSK